jgi:glutamate/tyrosine decarboxylase-like PLP-dependent enzyme
MSDPIAVPTAVRDLDWSAAQARDLGGAAVDLWAELLERLPDLPVGRRLGVAEVRAALSLAVPDEPLPPDALVAYLRTLMFENATYTGHSGFMAYITGTGTVPGAAADLLAAALNQNVGGWRLSPGATEIELQLMRWFADRLGFPETAGGLITSGGALAAFIALKAARDAKAGWDVRRAGVAAGPALTVYASAEVHDVNARAVDMLGLGADAMRLVPTDGALRMRVELLRAAIESDRREGRRPIAVVATAGTVGTGVIDPLEEIADVCAEYGLWFHVDGAYGGVAALVDTLRPLFRGIERADSVALDPHKWLYTPHSGGAIVVRDARHLTGAFDVHPTYTREDKELTNRGLDFFTMGPSFSRGFHALKIWVSLLAHGWAAYSRRIAHDVELARYLHARATAHEELEALAPQTLSIACFRYVPPGLANDLPGDAEREAYLTRLNERLMA